MSGDDPVGLCLESAEQELTAVEEPSKVREALNPISCTQAMGMWEALGSQPVLSTGIRTLDDAIGGGLPTRQVVVVSAYTGIGKSEFARQIARRVSGAGRLVIHVDVELGPEQINERYYAQESGLSPRRLLAKYDSRLTTDERQRLESARSRIVDNDRLRLVCPGGGVPVDELFGSLSMMLDGEHEPTLVVLDSLQRLAAGATGDNQRLQVQNFTWYVQAFAREHNVAVLLISEQSRNKEGKAPKAEDVLTAGAESRAVEFVADVVIGLIPETTPDDEMIAETPPNGEVIPVWDRMVAVIVAKNRRGRTGRLPERLIFSGPCWDMRTEIVERMTIENQINEALDDGPLTSRNIAKTIKRRINTVRVALRNMETEGAVEHRGHHEGWARKVIPSPDHLDSVPAPDHIHKTGSLWKDAAF